MNDSVGIPQNMNGNKSENGIIDIPDVTPQQASVSPMQPSQPAAPQPAASQPQGSTVPPMQPSQPAASQPQGSTIPPMQPSQPAAPQPQGSTVPSMQPSHPTAPQPQGSTVPPVQPSQPAAPQTQTQSQSSGMLQQPEIHIKPTMAVAMRLKEESQKVGRKLTKEEVQRILLEIEEEQRRAQERHDKYVAKSSNVLLGVIGALVGTLLGMAGMIFLDVIELWAAFASAFLLILAVLGYALLGGGIDKKGFFMCILLTLPALWIANRSGWTLWYIINLNETASSKYTFMEVFPDIKNRLEQLDDLLNHTNGLNGYARQNRSRGIMETYYMDTIASVITYFVGMWMILSGYFKRPK